MKAEEWTGDRARQKVLVQKIMVLARNDHPTDIAGACETILSNLVNDIATSYEEALRGIDAVADDMKLTIAKARGN